MVCSEGKEYRQRYERGDPTSELQIQESQGDRRGTQISFKPDREIFEATAQWDDIYFAMRLQELAYLNPGLEIVWCDRRPEPAEIRTYHYANGIRDYVAEVTHDRHPLHDIIYAVGEEDTFKFEVALQWCGDRDVDYLLKSFPVNVLFGQRLEEVYHAERLPHDSLYLLGFANQVRTIHGGTHIQGTIDGIMRSFDSKTWLQLRNGLTGIVSVMLLEPEYKGPMKWELKNPELREPIEDAVAKAISDIDRLPIRSR